MQIKDSIATYLNQLSTKHSRKGNAYKESSLQEIGLAFQPIIGLGPDTPIASEALARFNNPTHQPPDQWFSDTQSVGLGIDLELAATTAALGHVEYLREITWLAVNIGPEAITLPEVIDLLGLFDTSRIVIELTEHTRAEDNFRLVEVFSPLRGFGGDPLSMTLGSGFSSFPHII